jgi:predicted enzyme related to lactoylglutathione lyase
MIRRVKFVSIPVADQQRALKFYTEKLGFDILTDQPFDATQRWIELGIAGAETGVVLFTTREGIQPGSFMNMSWDTADVRAAYDTLAARGVTFIQPPTEQPWGTFAMFVDSEGNKFVLSQSRGR